MKHPVNTGCAAGTLGARRHHNHAAAGLFQQGQHMKGTTFKTSAAAHPGTYFYWKNIKSKTRNIFEFGDDAHPPLSIPEHEAKAVQTPPGIAKAGTSISAALPAAPSTASGTFEDFLSSSEPPSQGPQHPQTNITSSQQPPTASKQNPSSPW